MGRGRALADLPMDELARRYCAGESVREVAAGTGVHYVTVFNRLRDAGVVMRPPGREPRLSERGLQKRRAYLIDPDFDPDEREVVRDYLATHRVVV